MSLVVKLISFHQYCTAEKIRIYLCSIRWLRDLVTTKTD